jgi:alpha-L-fucosidase
MFNKKYIQVKRITFTLVFMLLLGSLFKSRAQEYDISRAEKPGLASSAQMQWFRDARYGLFIHWSPGCMSGKELSWARRGSRLYDSNGHLEEEKTVPAEVYDNYYTRFNPTKFDADEWVQLAKDAGMKYIVFTSKHHDGFSNFHTAWSDYSIAHTPFQRDIVKELADACHRNGMRFGIYYSVRDWYHSEYLRGNNSKYREFYTGQLRELLTNYGKVDVLWFDSTFGPDHLWDFEGVLKMIFSLQPDILINDRYGKGWDGDYYTPEQHLGSFDRDRPWETCATLVDGQWSHRPNGILLSLRESLGLLLGAVGGDGNLLLNIGPPPNGKIEDRQAGRLREVGNWLSKYGEGVYGTRGGPYIPGHWGYSTLKDNNIYLFLNPWDGTELTLPDPGTGIIFSSLLDGGNLKVNRGNGKLTLIVPENDRQEPFTVVKLRLASPALEIAPMKVPPAGSVTAGKKVTASSNGMPRLWWHNPCHPVQAVDDNPNTRWRADEGSSSASLEIELGETYSFGSAVIEDDGSVEEFEIEAKTVGIWKTVYRGTTIGRRLRVQFEPVRSDRVRLNILSATDTPSIWEFQIYPVK